MKKKVIFLSNILLGAVIFTGCGVDTENLSIKLEKTEKEVSQNKTEIEKQTVTDNSLTAKIETLEKEISTQKTALATLNHKLNKQEKTNHKLFSDIIYILNKQTTYKKINQNKLSTPKEDSTFSTQSTHLQKESAENTTVQEEMTHKETASEDTFYKIPESKTHKLFIATTPDKNDLENYILKRLPQGLAKESLVIQHSKGYTVLWFGENLDEIKEVQNTIKSNFKTTFIKKVKDRNYKKVGSIGETVLLTR